jgi:photosystem II stability/assembly factor-like uncharacterized protein
MKRAVLSTIYLLIINLNITLAQWTHTSGPGGGIVNDLAVAGNRFFAGLSSGEGVYMSSDSGSSWVQVKNGLPYQSIAQLLKVNDSVIALTGNSIYISDTNGTQWFPRNSWPGQSIEGIASNGSSVFLASDLGFYASADNGLTWQLLRPGLRFHHLFSVDSLLFALSPAGTESDSLNVSADQGYTWTVVGEFAPIHDMTRCGNYLFAGTEGTRVLRSADNGLSWSYSSNGITDPWIFSLCTRGNALFAGSSYGRIFISYDYGTNWSISAPGIAAAELKTLACLGNTVLAGSYGGIFRLTPSSPNWVHSNTGMPASMIKTIGFNSTTVFAGAQYEGLFISYDDGNNWTQPASGLPAGGINAIHCFGNNVFASPDSGGIYVSTNNGLNWNMVCTAGSNCIASNATTLFSGGGSSIYRSTDAGSTWAPTSYSGPYIITAVTQNDTVFAGTGSGIYLSTDNGVNWQPRGLTNKLVRGIAFIHGKLFAAADGTIYCSTDLGNSWFINHQYNDYIAMYRTGNVLLAVSDYGVIYSTDEGSSWHSLGNGIPYGVWNHLLCANSTSAFLGTWGSGIWKRDLAELFPLFTPETVRNDRGAMVIYPNPTRGTITLYPGKPGSSEMRIKDPVGRILYSEKIQSPQEGFVKTLDLSGYAKGVYFIELVNGETREVKRVVIE